ncbi:MAG: transporter substrate-binding domain-containing protein [Rhodospirillaceae bacterium]|nr:transporter substrate-binding domain-containing protein [Rhodospirillaceae bacterium]MBT7265736.1 transporter substrate-binding domain-containing protein [Rhodospirillaceae bacterium]
MKSFASKNRAKYLILHRFIGGIILALALLGASNVRSQEQTATVGMFVPFPPYIQENNNQELEGYVVDLLAELSKYSKIKFEYKRLPVGRASFDALKNGTIDIIPSAGITEARRKIFEFTRPIETFRISLFVRKNSLGGSKFSDLTKLKIGVVRANAAERILKKRNLSNTRIFPDPTSGLVALISGQIEALAYPEPVLWLIAKNAKLAEHIKIAGPPIATIKRGMAVKRGQTALRLKLDHAVGQFIESEAYLKIYAKWFGTRVSFWTPRIVALIMGAILLLSLFAMGIWRYRTMVNLNQELTKAVRRAENVSNELVESNKAFRSLYQTSPIAFVTCDEEDHAILRYNPAFTSLTRYLDEDVANLTLFDICPDVTEDGGNGRAKLKLLLERFRENGIVRNEELELERKDGQRIWTNFSIDQILHERPGFHGFRCSLIDITDRKLGENILRVSETRFRDFANAAADRFWETDGDHRYSYLSGSSNHINPPEKLLLGKCPWEIDHRKMSEDSIHDVQRLFNDQTAFRGVRQIWANPNGNVRTISMNGVPIWDENGDFKGFRGTTIDITEQVSALERSTDNRRKLIDALDSAAESVVLWDADDRMVLCNENYRKTHQEVSEHLTPGILFSEFIEKIADVYGPENRDEWIKRELAEHKSPPESYEGERNGEYYLVHKRVLDDGSTIAFHSNITKLKQREFALAESESRFSKIFQASPNLQSITEIKTGRMVDVNDAWLSSLGFERDQVIGKTAIEIGITVDFDMSARQEMINNIYNGGRAENYEARLYTSDGDMRTFLSNAEIIELGGVDHLLLVSDDITKDRQIAEELHQAQKMEAVGQLTGGIAHDFNNILSSVLGNLELMEGKVEPNNNVSNHIERAKKSVLRAADLTKRLLAFSRKQALNSETTNLNAHIPDILGIIERTLGESISINFGIRPNLWNCMVDRNQLDNVIVNLSINARDAMPKGGRLDIDVTNRSVSTEEASDIVEVIAGDYVVLTIADNGDGISPENLEHVIEPFFTTKDVGQGSGLGLSMVYGFIKQSGGFLKIESDAGKGTEIKLYIPRSEEGEYTFEGSSQDFHDIPLGHGESVLVIEDDPDVREVAINTLDNLGYLSIDGGDGSNIHEFTETHLGQLDLVLSDLILPGGQTGKSVTDKVLKKFPNAKIVYMTGYADRSIIEQQDGRLRRPIIGKPFETNNLARKIHEVLAN